MTSWLLLLVVASLQIVGGQSATADEEMLNEIRMDIKRVLNDQAQLREEYQMIANQLCKSYQMSRAYNSLYYFVKLKDKRSRN